MGEWSFRVSRSVPASGGGGKPIVREWTKSGKARIVRVADPLLPVVRRWAEGKQPIDLLFTAPQGGWISLSNWWRSVHWTETSRGRRPHDLRHTAATAWSAGVDAKTVQAWLGHASAELVLNLYGHHMGTDSDRTGIARMNRALGQTRSRPKGSPAPKPSRTQTRQRTERHDDHLVHRIGDNPDSDCWCRFNVLQPRSSAKGRRPSTNSWWSGVDATASATPTWSGRAVTAGNGNRSSVYLCLVPPVTISSR
jgi:hypothetical protein